ncbi:MAG: hypothetical protein OS112_00100 [Methanoregula sp.]|nr:MAG: hypothetical protein OS112_00100 [Methanoregula sp.]
MMSTNLNLLVFLLCIVVIFSAGCAEQPDAISSPPADRESKIPADAVKVTPQTDPNPPESLSTDYKDPEPVTGDINTAGAEDSPFVLPDGNTLYVFFTPDVRVPVEKQIVDGVTGIWVSKKVKGVWQKPERVVLQDSGKVSGDGCEFVLGNTMWFCSVREGYSGIHWFTADLVGGSWTNWKNADFNPEYKVGELHIFNNELYYHSDRAGGKGGLDIWVLKKANGNCQQPQNVAAVNTLGDEGWPALSPDGSELWISKDYSVWRSKKANGEWTAPEKMFSPLAGEASIDRQGNVYFVHHFFKDDKMVEADIYFAARNTT